MNSHATVFACIDGLATTHAVVDSAFWAAQRVQAPMALLHALERPEPMPPVGDYSGVIGMGAQDVLLQRLNTLDEERSQVAQEAARRMLAEAQTRVDSTRIPSLQVLLRHGDLTDVLLEQESEARLFVLGRQHRATAARKQRLDHRLESVIRSVRQPVMVMTTPTVMTMPRQSSTPMRWRLTAKRPNGLRRTGSSAHSGPGLPPCCTRWRWPCWVWWR